MTDALDALTTGLDTQNAEGSRSMVKKVKIVAHYQVNMYCDECGARLFAKDIPDSPMQYLYKCVCGWEKISEHKFPYTVLEYDEKSAQIIAED